MPRPKGKQVPEVVHIERRLIWAQTGQYNEQSLMDWDPKQVELVQALLSILATGATVVLRPGSGYRSIGLAIWEGDHRHPPVWVYDQDEMDDWAKGILEKVVGKTVEE